jgi:hypothetical protein
MKQDANAIAACRLQDPERGLRNIFGAAGFDSRQTPVMVRFDGGLPGTERAFLFRFGPAYRTTHREYLPQ